MKLLEKSSRRPILQLLRIDVNCCDHCFGARVSLVPKGSCGYFVLGGAAGIGLQPSSFRSWFWCCVCGCLCASVLSDPVSKFPFVYGLWFWFGFLCLTGSFSEGLGSHKPTQAQVRWIIVGGLIDVSRCAMHASITFGVAVSADGATAPIGRTGWTFGNLRSGRAYSDAFPWGAGHGTLRWTHASEQAGKALRSQGHQCVVM